MTNREAVSKVLNPLRLLVKDSHISRRSVLRILRDISKNLISKKLLDRTLQKDTGILTKVECFEFEPQDIKNCSQIEFRRCNTLMKSVKKVPTPIFSRLGSSIHYIESVDGNYQLELMDIRQFQRNKNRRESIKDTVYVYLGEDMHLYIPDHEIMTVDFSLITMETEKCTGCQEDDCRDAWDAEFICPDKLEDVVFKEALNILSSTYRSIVPDQNPNSVENG